MKVLKKLVPRYLNIKTLNLLVFWFKKRNWRRCVFNCINLKEVILNEGLEKLAEAFRYTNIKSISIPGSRKEIGKYAFSVANTLKK
ncbi:leucine-rich repeat protein [Metamycoplasma hominis]|uniref:leucine-rich repeat protein n=1 Tax=Metamycoplasma hominis TaxID=2098 RepID=UPI003A5C84C8